MGRSVTGDADVANALVWVSRMDRLAAGEFAGIMTVADFKSLGDTGLGTFAGLNGELVLLEGEAYRICSDGSVGISDDAETIPFGNVWRFRLLERVRVDDAKGLEAWCAALDDAMDASRCGSFRVAVLDGRFTGLLVRSAIAQAKPYAPLDQTLERNEVRFSLDAVEGTVVAVYSPRCTDGVAELGWHLHFVSADKTVGGHVLGLGTASVTGAWGATDKLDVWERA